jgi:hypothetical protein
MLLVFCQMIVFCDYLNVVVFGDELYILIEFYLVKEMFSKTKLEVKKV